MGVGFALASQAVHAQAIKTDYAGMQAGEVSLPAGPDSLPAYMARPATGSNWPVIVVVSEIFGVHEYIADVCRRFAKEGFMAIAPEFFHRTGDPSSLGTIAEIQTQIISKTPDASVLADINYALDWARQQGGDLTKASITGFCWGGRITWLACAENPRLKRGVAWYGRLTGEQSANFPRHPVDIAAQIKAPVLGLYGGADTGISLEQVKRMEAALKSAAGNAAAQASRIDVYPDAPHAFHADYRNTYREDIARDAWSKALKWLK